MKKQPLPCDGQARAVCSLSAGDLIHTVAAYQQTVVEFNRTKAVSVLVGEKEGRGAAGYVSRVFLSNDDGGFHDIQDLFFLILGQRPFPGSGFAVTAWA